MASLEDLHRARWEFLAPGIDFVPGHGIPDFWMKHPELGSPIEPEADVDDADGGGRGQVFAGGIVRWTEERGAWMVGADAE